MSYFLENFPDRKALLRAYGTGSGEPPMKVNNHIHSPYSFSAFSSISEAVRLASQEDVKILGINDFYVRDGYEEFVDRCVECGIFPLLNIELIGISGQEQEKGIRVNDPGNPGRTYISGKGLAFHSLLPEGQQTKLDKVVRESNHQVSEMITLLNRWLANHGTGISLSVEEIMNTLAMNLLRERHVAKMMRIRVEEHAVDEGSFQELLSKIYGGKPSDKKRGDVPGLEDELRTRLLKAGAPAFVPEDEKAFLPLQEIMQIITDAGGIPTYPMLLDGAGGRITGFEDGKEQLLAKLRSRGFGSVELIPLRNRFAVLKEYAGYFYENGFVVSFGTEHNTSAMGPLTVSCLHGDPLDEQLMEISYKGAACVAAHQYLVVKEGIGYTPMSRGEMEVLGKSIFQHYFGNCIKTPKK
ncbi:MAG: PHP domain-containing protein [Bacteroidota bacterium]